LTPYSGKLHYHKQWLALGGLWVVLVIFLSVANLAMPQLPFLTADKLYHLLAYGLLMGWFGQLYRDNHSRLVVALCLIALGLLLEIVQSMLPHRWFDYYDAAANTVGVLLALAVLKTGCGRILTWFERTILRATH